MKYLTIIDQEARTRIAGGYGFIAPKKNGGSLEVGDSTDQPSGIGGGILFSGRHSPGSTLQECGAIQTYKETPTGNPFGLLFSSHPDGGPLTNRWFIESSGHLRPWSNGLNLGDPEWKVGTAYITTLGSATDPVSDGYFETIDTRGETGILLNNPSSNLIQFRDAVGSTGMPSFTSRTPGNKIVLWPAWSSGASTVDYAIGLGSGTVWFSVPQSSATYQFRWYGGETVMMSLTKGNLILGGTALPTRATDGFLYISTMNGAPTGTPTSFAGRVPMVYDTADNHFYIYSGGWKKVALS